MKNIKILIIALILSGCAGAGVNYTNSAPAQNTYSADIFQPESQYISVEDTAKSVFKITNSKNNTVGTAFVCKVGFDVKENGTNRFSEIRLFTLTAAHVASALSQDKFFLVQGNHKFKIDNFIPSYKNEDISIIVSKELYSFISSNDIPVPPLGIIDQKTIKPLSDVMAINNSDYGDLNTEIYTKGFIIKNNSIEDRLILHMPVTSKGASGSPVYSFTDSKSILGLITNVKFINNTEINTGVTYAINVNKIYDELLNYYTVVNGFSRMPKTQ